MEFAAMTDPDVTLTDYGLALLCAWFVWRMWRGPRFGPARFWLVLFFAAASAAPLLGGTVHGFFDLEGFKRCGDGCLGANTNSARI